MKSWGMVWGEGRLRKGLSILPRKLPRVGWERLFLSVPTRGSPTNSVWIGGSDQSCLNFEDLWAGGPRLAQLGSDTKFRINPSGQARGQGQVRLRTPLLSPSGKGGKADGLRREENWASPNPQEEADVKTEARSRGTSRDHPATKQSNWDLN